MTDDRSGPSAARTAEARITAAATDWRAAARMLGPRDAAWSLPLTDVLPRSVMSDPSRKIRPSVGLSIPTISLASVDFPLPFGPVTTTKVLSFTTRFKPWMISFLTPSFSTEKDRFLNSSVTALLCVLALRRSPVMCHGPRL